MIFFLDYFDFILLVCCILVGLKMLLGHRSSESGRRFSLTNWWTKRKIENWIDKNRRSINWKHEKLPKCANRGICDDDNYKLDQYQFFGCDIDGSTILIDIKITNDQNEAFLYFKLKDGRVLTFPNQLATATNQTKAPVINVNGLTVENLVPYIKWRINFNGLLRVHKVNTITENNFTDINVDKDFELQHVIFTFFWNAASDPLSWPNEWCADLLLNSLNADKMENTLDKLLASEMGFDQCGALMGQISIDNSDEKEIFEVNLPGIRRNRSNDIALMANNNKKCVTTIGVARDGCIFVILEKTFPNQLPVHVGYVRQANGKIIAIEQTLLPAIDLKQQDASNELNIKFSTIDRKEYSTKIITEPYSPTIDGFDKIISTIKIDLNGIEGNGIIICHEPVLDIKMENSIQINNNNNEAIKHSIYTSDTSCDRTKLTVRFEDAAAQNAELCGGKGSSLGFLTCIANEKNSPLDFIVPKGFTLTSTAFNLQVQQNNKINAAIESLENIAYKRLNGSLEEACTILCDLLKVVQIENEIVAAVRASYSSLKENCEKSASFKLAIRSSAVGEDGDGASSAGQNETFLGVDGVEQVLNAIQKCWASLFTFQSVVYRLQNVQSVRTPMAVVIQLMVPSECAGVLFTRYPVNNDPNKLLITANFGLGESVVSGVVDPDVFIIHREYRNNNLIILERKLGDKTQAIYMKEENDVATLDTDSERRNQFCLNDNFILKLCEIGIYLEQCYNSPRDIEWAIHKNNIYLLQSRPMTTINSFSSWELLHEFDTAVMSAEDYSTFGNVGEVMPEVLTPLTLSVISSSLNKAIRSNITDEKSSSCYFELFQLSHFRLAINVFNTFLTFTEKEINLAIKVHGLIVFGHDFVNDEVHRIAIHRFGIGTNGKKFELIWNLFKSCWNNKSVSNRLQQFMDMFCGTYDLDKLEKFTSIENLYDDISMKILEMNFPGKVHGATTKVSAFYQFVALLTLAEGNLELTSDHYSDIALMFGSCKDVVSAEIPVLLEQILEKIRKTNKKKDFCLVLAEDGVAWLKENCPEAHDLLIEFLKKHSHRAFVEFDFVTETWGMKPSLVIEMLQSSAQNSAEEVNSKPRKEFSNEEIAALLKTPKRPTTRKFIRWLLPHCKSSVQLREQSKSNLIMYIQELRKAYRFLAQKMQQNGLLPDVDLIFYLAHDEIGQILKENRTELALKALRRKRLFPEWRKLRFNEFHFGVVKPIDVKDSIQVNGDLVKVIGTPVCEGIITGPARVVHSFAEVNKIKSGDILITHCTDIAWSPYFPILAGVVTELGGLISHGAVVAREYGLPCIVGATNATAIIFDGDMINMNANTGVIVKIN